MFAKKQTAFDVGINPISMSAPFNQKSLNATHLNHEVILAQMKFFLLVRDHLYDKAYDLGQKILKENPNNPAVAKFCDFIKNNFKDLEKMIQDEQDYTDGSEDEDDEYSEEEGEDDDEDNESEEEKQTEPSARSSSSSILSKASSVSSKQQSSKAITSQKLVLKGQVVSKSQRNKENVHKWQHNCKNPNCPNKNKPHKH